MSKNKKKQIVKNSALQARPEDTHQDIKKEKLQEGASKDKNAKSFHYKRRSNDGKCKAI